jgi:cyclopropane fatty-acyl-phospholipid synthase-like methyltransferase
MAFTFHEFDVPDHLSVYVGASADNPATFVAVSNAQMELLDKYLGIEPHHTVLEIGCGPGKIAVPIAKRLTTGRFIGQDISKECIDWCNANIAAAYPRASFIHADIQNDMYNPHGGESPETYRLAVEDGSVDRIILFSVFTHLFESGVANYMREMRRVLKPDGRALASWFILSEPGWRHAREKPGPIGMFRFDHRVADNSFTNVAEHPLGAMGFTLPWIIDSARDAGLKLDYMVNAYWSGAHLLSDAGQDLTILSPR